MIGAGNLPSGVPKAASTAYARNIVALLAHLVRDGALVLDPADEITAGVLITHDGDIVHPRCARRGRRPGSPTQESPRPMRCRSARSPTSRSSS